MLSRRIEGVDNLIASNQQRRRMDGTPFGFRGGCDMCVAGGATDRADRKWTMGRCKNRVDGKCQEWDYTPRDDLKLAVDAYFNDNPLYTKRGLREAATDVYFTEGPEAFLDYLRNLAPDTDLNTAGMYAPFEKQFTGKQVREMIARGETPPANLIPDSYTVREQKAMERQIAREQNAMLRGDARPETKAQIKKRIRDRANLRAYTRQNPQTAYAQQRINKRRVKLTAREIQGIDAAQNSAIEQAERRAQQANALLPLIRRRRNRNLGRARAQAQSLSNDAGIDAIMDSLAPAQARPRNVIPTKARDGDVVYNAWKIFVTGMYDTLNNFKVLNATQKKAAAAKFWALQSTGSGVYGGARGGPRTQAQLDATARLVALNRARRGQARGPREQAIIPTRAKDGQAKLNAFKDFLGREEPVAAFRKLPLYDRRREIRHFWESQ